MPLKKGAFVINKGPVPSKAYTHFLYTKCGLVEKKSKKVAKIGEKTAPSQTYSF
jgi:hypothetical protein